MAISAMEWSGVVIFTRAIEPYKIKEGLTRPVYSWHTDRLPTTVRG